MDMIIIQFTALIHVCMLIIINFYYLSRLYYSVFDIKMFADYFHTTCTNCNLVESIKGGVNPAHHFSGANPAQPIIMTHHNYFSGVNPAHQYDTPFSVV